MNRVFRFYEGGITHSRIERVADGGHSHFTVQGSREILFEGEEARDITAIRHFKAHLFNFNIL